MVLSLTFVPASIAIFMGNRVQEKENRLVQWTRGRYEPLLAWSLRRQNWVLGGALALVAVSLLVATRLGSEFIPSLDEGDIAMHAIRIPGTGLEQSVKMQLAVEERLQQVPEVERVFSKIGTAEVATDPMPPNVADTFLMMKPRAQWPDPSKPKDVLLEEIEAAVATLPGNNYEFTQPIEMRTNELISGVRADVAVKVFGDDLDMLIEVAEQVEAVARQVDGAADVKTEQATGLPLLTIVPDRAALARFGLNPGIVQQTVATAVGGQVASQLFEGDRRFDIVVRLPEQMRVDPTALQICRSPCPTLRTRTGRAWSHAGRPRGPYRCGRSRRSKACWGPTRSTARMESAGWWSPPTCVIATWVALSKSCSSASGSRWTCPRATGSTTAARSSS